MHNLAAEKLNGEQSIVLSVCSKEEQMCTHYAPLTNIDAFLLGRPTSKDFNDDLGKEQVLDWYGMQLTLQYGKEKFMGWMGMGKKTKTGEEAKEEL